MVRLSGAVQVSDDSRQSQNRHFHCQLLLSQTGETRLVVSRLPFSLRALLYIRSKTCLTSLASYLLTYGTYVHTYVSGNVIPGSESNLAEGTSTISTVIALHAHRPALYWNV